MTRSTYARALSFSVAAGLLAVSGCQSGGQSGDGGAPGTGLIDARQPANTGRYIPLAGGSGGSVHLDLQRAAGGAAIVTVGSRGYQWHHP